MLCLPAPPLQGVSTTRSEHPQCRPGDLPAFQPRQVQQGSRVLLCPQVLVTAVVETTPPKPAHAPHQWPSELQRAHTTLRCSNFEHELRLHPDKAWVTWLLDGIDNCVSIGYTGSVSPLRSCNLSSAHAHPDVVDAELEKEITAGRIIGPFAEPPLHNLRTSGVGVVPKKDGKWRAILHLSAPDGHSVNDHINKEDFPVHYSSVDDAVALLSQYGQDALMAKIDLKAAFRLIPVQAADWVHLGICWRGHFCVDTCLPFGLRSAPALFNHYAEALDWIMANNYGAQLLHYLDDFLLVGPPSEDTCQETMSRMLTVCDQLGIPVASEKLEGPTTALTFLGIVLDTSAQQLRLPPGQARGADRANQVVPAGRLFLRRLIDLSTTVRKLHHHISLNAEARADIRWWDSFLPSWNGVAMFLDPEWTAADSLQLYTDASGSLGFGAYFNGAWFRGRSSTNPNLTSPALDLNHHLQLLLNRAMAPSTATTYATGIRRYQGFCHAFKLIPVPGTKETITLFAAHLSRTLNSRTIQDYVAAVSFLHHSMGYKSPASSNPTLRLAIRGVQCLQEPIHLKPTRLPLTVEMLGHMLQRFEAAPLKRHNRRMFRAALTLGFFGFLRVSEFTLKNRRFDPRYHPTRQDISWTREGMHFFIKWSKTDQMGKGTTICIGRTKGRHTCPVAAMEAYRGCCRCPIQPSPLFHFRDGRPLTSMSFRSTFLSLVEQCGYNPAQYNTHSLRIGAATAAARAGLPTETIQKLGRWRSSAYQTYTRHPLTHPSDTRTMAAQ
ncbi:hypothetical protein EMCRGX_G007418 [Ephydatia muelleri]